MHLLLFVASEAATPIEDESGVQASLLLKIKTSLKKLVHICIDKREKLFMTDRKVNPARSSIVHFASLYST